MITNFMGVLFQQFLSVPRQRINGAKAFCSAPERAAKFVRLGSPTHPICMLCHVPGARKNMYDSVVEYWVTIRERGMHEEEQEVLEKQTSTSKVGLKYCRIKHLKMNHMKRTSTF